MIKLSLTNALAAAGIIYLGKLAVDAIAASAFSKINMNYGQPSFNFASLLSANPSIGVNLPVVIHNNNSVGLNVSSFVGDIFYGSVKIASVSIPTPVQIPSNGAGSFNLAFNITALQVINDIVASMGQSGAYSTLVNTIRLKGVLETSLYRIPVDTNISLV